TDEGHVVAIADPTIVPPAGYRCANPDVPSASCIASGYPLVPQPAVIADVTVPDGGAIVWSEPALVTDGSSIGRVYVATEGGHVYLISPPSGGKGTHPPPPTGKELCAACQSRYESCLRSSLGDPTHDCLCRDSLCRCEATNCNTHCIVEQCPF